MVSVTPESIVLSLPLAPHHQVICGPHYHLICVSSLSLHLYSVFHDASAGALKTETVPIKNPYIDLLSLQNKIPKHVSETPEALCKPTPRQPLSSPACRPHWAPATSARLPLLSPNVRTSPPLLICSNGSLSQHIWTAPPLGCFPWSLAPAKDPSFRPLYCDVQRRSFFPLSYDTCTFAFICLTLKPVFLLYWIANYFA